ncbi:unnamed protein product [Callosobruchus maculatus]|uniref:FAD-binding PCMH-type domain-containing protein n=1 Tax=Callosobruchus maculatus TaxID=64391 RepID=A0A653CAG8_CALMS|nr:unnamed protein product [Callosobruchus maculatus]
MSSNSGVQLALRARSTLAPFGKSLLYTIRGKLSAGVPYARGYAAALPQLTKDRYQVQRGNYASIQDSDIQFFKDILGPTRVITDPDECIGYNVDWSSSVRGSSSCVLKPKTTDEVSKILSFCNSRKLAVCPQGGNTGLVEHNLMMPLDLGAKGSCHIGGNVSTNAGGLRLLRYGNLHGSKDNTGFHLKHLFIGSEGTLGVVTKVAIHCPPKPRAINLAFLDVVTSHLKLKSPLEVHPFYMVIETHGSNNDHDEEKLNLFLESAMEEGAYGILERGLRKV